jgi:hypothetical protein
MTFSGMMVLPNSHAEAIMERFLKRHRDRIMGSITGFDRLLFRGSLLSICHRDGLDKFLGSQGVLYKDWEAFVEQISGRIKAQAQQIAKEAGRPSLYLPSAQASKEELAQSLVKRDQIQEGLVCVLSCVEVCQTFGIRHDRETQRLKLVPQERKCLHLYFYYLDREFGLMHIRLQTWLPMTIQVCLNGREWLARRMDQVGIAYVQKDNCFTWIADPPRAQALLEELVGRRWAKVLNAWARRVNPWLAPYARPRWRSYYWMVRESEYATDVMFKSEEALGEVYPALCRHAIEQFSAPQVLRFLGRRPTPRFNGEVRSYLERRVEGVCVKHWAEENSIKMYDKQGSVLRVETTLNNPRRFCVRRSGMRKGQRVLAWLPLRKGIADIRRRVQLSRAANERYLEALAVVGDPTPSHRILDPVSQRVQTPQRCFRALRPISPQDSRVFAVLLRGEYNLQGVRNQDLRRQLFDHEAPDPARPRSLAGRVTRLLLLLRAHGLIYRVAKTYYYRFTEKGREVMNTALRFRETNFALLAPSNAC